VAGENRMACCKQGIVPPSYSCRRFSYDPLKRVPPRPNAPDFQKYDQKDYSL
jgi:hypothetical protein